VKKLYRSRTNRKIWGVCGGLANYFGIDPTIVRILAIIALFLSGFGIMLYIIMTIIIPLESPINTNT
jgi:phage shock protein C